MNEVLEVLANLTSDRIYEEIEKIADEAGEAGKDEV